MASEKTTATVATPAKKPVLMLAEFDTTSAVLHAAETLRKAGYRRFDSHTPFPVHGMDRAMGLPDSRLGWIVLAMGGIGLSVALGMMIYMNGIDYPLIIGGKPPASIPSLVPVAFELTVLFASFGAVFGMLGLNRLPRMHHPLFYSDRFRAATDDKFFISVDAVDPKYDPDETRKLLEAAHASHIEIIEEDVT